MNTAYIYSVSRTNTLGTELLSKTDIDRLLVASRGAELQAALKETYLAPYVLQVSGEDVAVAIENTLIQAKKLIHRIAPDGDSFRVLWVQYDMHNLRVFAKAHAAKNEQGSTELNKFVSKRGIYEPDYLHAAAESGTLNSLQSGWQEAYDAGVQHVEVGELDRVDVVFDSCFFATIKRIADKSNDIFIKQYVTAVIDFYNLKRALRRERLSDDRLPSAFVAGGTIPEQQLDDYEAIVSIFETLAPGFFTAALASYKESGNTSELDACIDDYFITFAKSASVDMFSSASLVLYYLRVRQSAANIRTIVVGRNSGQSGDVIRRNLRLAYVN